MHDGTYWLIGMERVYLEEFFFRILQMTIAKMMLKPADTKSSKSRPIPTLIAVVWPLVDEDDETDANMNAVIVENRTAPIIF